MVAIASKFSNSNLSMAFALAFAALLVILVAQGFKFV